MLPKRSENSRRAFMRRVRGGLGRGRQVESATFGSRGGADLSDFLGPPGGVPGDRPRRYASGPARFRGPKSIPAEMRRPEARRRARDDLRIALAEHQSSVVELVALHAPVAVLVAQDFQPQLD